MRRRPNMRDNLVGMFRSVRNGTSMNPLSTMREINIAHDERVASERNSAFGAGTVGGNRNWEAPFHATTREGRLVTVSFGKGTRAGETLICDGHVDLDTFYGNKNLRIAKGHDHFDATGSYAAKRGKYRG
jgi:hypothetical protein